MVLTLGGRSYLKVSITDESGVPLSAFHPVSLAAPINFASLARSLHRISLAARLSREGLLAVYITLDFRNKRTY